MMRVTHTANNVSDPKHMTMLLNKTETVAGVRIDLMEGLCVVSSELFVVETSLRAEDTDSLSVCGETVP
jgi:hypothetical protein